MKWTTPDDFGKVHWTLRDISMFEFKSETWHGHYHQWLQYEWKNEDGHGVEKIDLKDYPMISSKE